MTNKILFIANWKMFGDLNSLNSLNSVVKFSKTFKMNKYIKIVYCPPSTLIHSMSKMVKNTPIEIGGQNCHEHSSFGAFTGSINPLMLKNVGAKYVIIGHSENRKTGDTDKLINLKIKNALKSGLKVIFCIGETLSEKRKKKTKRVLNKQIKIGLSGVKNKKNILVAYEPFWAIGSGLTPKYNELFETIGFIKDEIKLQKVLYGGSVNNKNINKLKNIKIIDGFLIGGESQKSKKFIDIIKKTFN